MLLSLAHLQGEGKVQMHDAVIVAKDGEGRSRTVETVDVTPAKGALAGSWWGLLCGVLVGGPIAIAGLIGGAAAGALYGKLVDRGLEDAWVKSMAAWIDPDSSALLLRSTDKLRFITDGQNSTNGSVTFRKIVHREAPSTDAASTSSCGTPCSAAR